jgi:hypothetical protein
MAAAMVVEKKRWKLALNPTCSRLNQRPWPYERLQNLVQRVDNGLKALFVLCVRHFCIRYTCSFLERSDTRVRRSKSVKCKGVATLMVGTDTLTRPTNNYSTYYTILMLPYRIRKFRCCKRCSFRTAVDPTFKTAWTIIL